MANRDSGDRRRVLLVDDEEVLAWSLATRLAKVRPHFTVDTANDGETALAKIRESGVDLLVADVRMPGMSGIDLVVASRSKLPDLPVIVMTAFKTPDVQRVAGESRTEFLEKPFEFERFLELVDRAIENRKVGFSGAISVQTLPDVVQLYVLSNTTGKLVVRHHSGEGQLWFEQGTIRHAITHHGKGEEAFFEIMMWSGGDFSMRLGAVSAEKSITSNWQELLMESCRRIDERKRSDEVRSSRSGWTQSPPPPSEEEIDDVFEDLDIGGASFARSVAVQPIPTEEPLEATMNIKDSLAKLNSIDGFVGAALVDSESGMLLGQEGGGGINLEVAAAGNTEVVKAKRKTMNNLNLKDGIEDILITLGRQYHLIRLAQRESLRGTFSYLVLDRGRANLALARRGLAQLDESLSL
jgi:CheY-like chemotaxis protein